MSAKTLTLKQLNRTFLARQFLLERHDISPIQAIERLIGLQSQIPNPPYIGLWTRLKNFERDDLTKLMENREVVRAPLIRSTLHIITADDHKKFQSVLQPALDRYLKLYNGKKNLENLDFDKLQRAAKPFLEEQPRTTGDLRQMLLDIEPDGNDMTMASVIRHTMNVVQVPPGGTWGSSSRASYVLAQTYLGDATPSTLEALLHRYLRAFGPASIMDFQAWIGMTSLTSKIKPMMKNLITYQTEDGNTLLDLPDMDIINDNNPAPIRFIPEYDNLLVSHKDRNRIIADDDRKYVFLSSARVLSTILIDGFVGATWKIQREKDVALLKISLFEQQNDHVIEAIDKEGHALIRFIEDSAETYIVEYEVYAD